MSRIGKRIINLPENTTLKVDNTIVTVTGKLGTLNKEFSPLIKVAIDKDNNVSTTRTNEEKHTKQLHGTTNSLLSNMIKGVSIGFQKEIEIKGVGYRASLKDNQIIVNAGYSHPVFLDIINGVEIKIPKPTEIMISGTDKQKVGQMAALIRDIRRPNPYSGKGIMYKGEHIRRKAGKVVTK